MSTKNEYFGGAISLYINYFAYGAMAIMFSQLKDPLSLVWNTNAAGIMGIIAWTGLGKVTTVYISGELSDRFGRKKMALIGTIGYLCFFVGLIFCKSIAFASVLAFLFGLCNSLMDSASMTGLQEAFPKTAGTAVVLQKGVISVCQMIFPLFVGFLMVNKMDYKIAIYVPLAVMVVAFLILLKAKFAYDETTLKMRKAAKNGGEEAKAAKLAAEKAAAEEAAKKFISKPKFEVEGVCFLIYGFVSMMTFYLISQVITMYGKDFIGMAEMASRALMSYYTFGSLAAVLISSTVMAKGFRSIAVLQIYTIGSSITLVALALFPSPIVASVCSAAIGFFAAGGALQLGFALMSEFFPGNKGRWLGIYYSCMGVASYVGPLIAKYFMASKEYNKVIYFDAAIAILGLIIMQIVGFRYRQVFGSKVFSLKKD